jgi:dienelactone hydrolase/N-formylglutamate amidohydrolase
MLFRSIPTLMAWFAATMPLAWAADRPPSDLVLTQSGSLPIILTAPHGGREPVPGIPPRSLEGKKDIVTYRAGGDPGTDIIVQMMAREIRTLTGKDVYMVMARFDRKFIDANRGPTIAYDNPASEPYYQHYHQSIRRFVDEIRARYAAGLLIDVHGQRKFPDHLVRGTWNGRAVTKLLGRAGVAAITGRDGLYGQLEANGFAVFPGNDVPPSGSNEDAGFNGGYTVTHYGSHKADGIDAVLFEFGAKHRQKPEIEDWAKRAARAVVAFYETYLKTPEKIEVRAATTEGDPWLLTRDIEIVSRWPQGSRLHEDRVSADLYRPRDGGRLPAAVIINSSGGVSPYTEHYYARLLARHGMAGLVVDSFTARRVRRTADDQSRVSQDKSNADAFAGYRWLTAQPWADASRIIVLGMSRGGEAAYSAAIEGLRKRMEASDTKFAAHVAIAPGSCNFQLRDPRTTGAPIMFMLAELDDVLSVPNCVDLIQRMRATGPSNIRIAVYPGVHHGFENTAGIVFAEKDWNSGGCAGRFLRDESNVLYDRATGRRATKGDQADFLAKTCLKRGHRGGGDDRVKSQASADLLQFLRDVEVLHDEEARAAVPDCQSIPQGIARENCARARNGWTGDLVALARAIRAGSAGPTDEVIVARLFELAAKRGNLHAQFELSILLRQGRGITRDLPRAVQLARAAAEAGDPAAMNTYAVIIRDGIGRPADDAEAAVWFQRSADLRNSFGMTNLGRMMWDGRGGLPRDRAAATALWRRAVFLDRNPRAAVLLADALESGEGVAPDKAEAIRLYEVAASQEFEIEAKQRAVEALARLGK